MKSRSLPMTGDPIRGLTEHGCQGKRQRAQGTLWHPRKESSRQRMTVFLMTSVQWPLFKWPQPALIFSGHLDSSQGPALGGGGADRLLSPRDSSGYKEEVGKVKKMCSLCTVHPALQPQASPDAAILLSVTVSH